MEREKAKRVLVLGAIAALAVAELAQAVSTHRLAEQVKNHMGAPVIALSTQPVAMTNSAWGHPFAYLRQVQRAVDQQERAMTRAFPLWPAPMTVGLPLAPPEGAAETVSLQTQPGQYVVRAKLPPGVGTRQVKVELVGRQLSLDTRLAGQIKGQGDQGAQTYSSAYVESFTLPGPVVDQAMKQRFKDGVLTVTIPRAQGQKVTL